MFISFQECFSDPVAEDILIYKYVVTVQCSYIVSMILDVLCLYARLWRLALVWNISYRLVTS